MSLLPLMRAPLLRPGGGASRLPVGPALPAALAVAIASLGATSAATAWPLRAPPELARFNYASHPVELFRNLLRNRVQISTYKRRALARWYGPDGYVSTCFWHGGRYQSSVSDYEWTVAENREDYATLIIHRVDGQSGSVIPFYDPPTGRYHSERKTPLRVWGDGWLQESWPLAMTAVCPRLPPPPGVPVNEIQTSLDQDRLRRQDPSAPIRHFPGSWATRTLGGTGIAAARGELTFNREDLVDFLRRQAGQILRDPRQNPRHSLIPLPDPAGDGLSGETWLSHDPGRIYKAFTLRFLKLSEGDQVILPHGMTPVGRPLPSVPTGERFPAFGFTDRLIRNAEPVSLPLSSPDSASAEAARAPMIFAADGRLASPPGRWRWTEGRLEVRLDGFSEPANVAWSKLANHPARRATFRAPDPVDIDETISWLAERQGRLLLDVDGNGFVPAFSPTALGDSWDGPNPWRVGEDIFPDEVWQVDRQGHIVSVGRLAVEDGVFVIRKDGKILKRWRPGWSGWPFPFEPANGTDAPRAWPWTLTDELAKRGLAIPACLLHRPPPVSFFAERPRGDLRIAADGRTVASANTPTGRWAWTDGRLWTRLPGHEGLEGDRFAYPQDIGAFLADPDGPDAAWREFCKISDPKVWVRESREQDQEREQEAP